MSIFFDFKTINELIGDNYYRQPKEFTLEDLSQYNESNDVVDDILTNTPKAEFLIDDDYMSDINNMNLTSTMTTNRQVKQDTSKFTPDDWIRYIAPLVTYALRETTQGIDAKRAYQKFILLGVLVGLGKTPQEAISQVQGWQNTGASQLLKSGTSTGSAATSGNIGTGVTSTDGSGGIGIEGRTVLPPYLTSFKFVNGGMGIGGGTGTSDGTMPTNSQVKQDTSKFTPDDWIRYVDPLVTYALRETTQGMNTKRSYQKFILLGVLVGLGKTPQEAINQVQEWQNTGASQLLKSGTSTGGTGTSGGIGTGVTSTGATTATSGNTNKSNRLYFE
jgi:hypothetical protein